MLEGTLFVDSFVNLLLYPSSETHREEAQCNQTFKRNDTLQRDQHLRSNAHTPALFAAWKLVSVEKGCPGGIRTTTSPNRLGVHRSKIFQILIFSEGTKPPNFQEISLQHLKFPEEFRENFESFGHFDFFVPFYRSPAHNFKQSRRGVCFM